MTDTPNSHATLIAERDLMVTELRKRWPSMVADMADLLRRLDTNRRHTDHAGIASAEAIARGVVSENATSGGHQDFVHVADIRRLGAVVLPQLDASTPHARSVMAWGN